MLHEAFSLRRSNQTRIALIGLRGAGKTTLGKLIEQRYRLPFVSLVETIELLGGMRVSEILALSGQNGYAHRVSVAGRPWHLRYLPWAGDRPVR